MPRLGRTRRVGTIWWAPNHTTWRIAFLFVVGSACFALGALPPYADAVRARADGVTFFVGSLFFTAAALLQLLVSVGAVPATGHHPMAAVQWRALRQAPHRAEWWAGIVQFAGTILFNISTFDALQQALDATEANRRVWAPDMLGSIAFLVASALAYAVVKRPWITWRPKDLDWSVATLNMVGSIAFMASALAAYVIEDGSLRNAELANAGTWVGGVCFLLGAIFLIPEELAPAPEPEAASAPA